MFRALVICLRTEMFTTDGVVSDDTPLDSDRQDVNCQQSEQQNVADLVGDDLFLMPLVSKRSSQRLRRTSLQLYRKSRHEDLVSEMSEEKCSEEKDLDKEMHINERCLEEISSKPDVALPSAQTNEHQDTCTTSRAPKVARQQRKRKNIAVQQHHSGKSEDAEIENVIASLAACSSGVEESVANDSQLLLERNVQLQPIDETCDEQSSTIADAPDPPTKICADSTGIIC